MMPANVSMLLPAPSRDMLGLVDIVDNQTELDTIVNYFTFNDDDLKGLEAAPSFNLIPENLEDSDCRVASGTLASAWTEDAAAECEAEHAQTSKRRRRIRNQKQQELNRLAQQRYRQRKKQRYCDLQSTVDVLTSKLAALKAAEEEVAVLQASTKELTKQLATKDAELQQARQHIEAQERRLAEKEHKIEEQNQLIETQRMQLIRSGLPRGLEPQVLCDHLLSVFKAALAEVACTQPGLQEALVQHIGRTLQSCCRELHAPKASPPSNDTPPIPVPCC